MASESQTAVSQVKFTEWTRDDRLRQPVFLGIRQDNNAIEVVREKATLRQRIYCCKSLSIDVIEAREAH
jgi:ATP-dependent DNA ligase